MIDLSDDEECIDYEVNTRECHVNDHVLSKWSTEDDPAVYYSGVILEVDTAHDEFLIVFDYPALPDNKVPHSSVHPCSTVSYDYRSDQLPPHCVPHCASG